MDRRRGMLRTGLTLWGLLALIVASVEPRLAAQTPPNQVLPVARQDTARPPVPPTPNLPDDSTLTVPSPSGRNVRYHRNIVVIAFDDSTRGVSVRRILAKYGGVIIGGSEARDEPAYYVQIPDR